MLSVLWWSIADIILKNQLEVYNVKKKLYTVVKNLGI
jgi:hypothetical protein